MDENESRQAKLGEQCTAQRVPTCVVLLPEAVHRRAVRVAPAVHAGGGAPQAVLAKRGKACAALRPGESKTPRRVDGSSDQGIEIAARA